MGEVKHTPGLVAKYLIDNKPKRWAICAENGNKGIVKTILDNAVTPEEKEANADFIVQTWNSYDDLLAACKAALEFVVLLDLQQKTVSGLGLQLNAAIDKAEGR